jgi:hypothetical protein
MPSDPCDPSTPFSDGAATSKNRSDMVESARQFMTTPKVRNTPFEEQKKFLLEKGLTESEINEAVKMLPPPEASTSSTVPYQYQNQQQMYYPPPPPQSFGGKIYSFTQSVVVIGGASYMAYKLMRSWVLPKFFNIPESENDNMEHLQTKVNELQNSNKFILDSVQQQEEKLDRALSLMSQNGGTKNTDITKLQTDVAIVKSLLLNQNQFPAILSSPTPSSTPANGVVLKQPKTVRWQTNSIPSWQLSNNENGLNGTKNDNTNGHLNGNGKDEHSENGEEKQDEDEFVEAQNDSV